MSKILYLIQHKNLDQYTKIGYTTDFDKRLKSLQTASPTGIHLVYKVSTEYAPQIEKLLHRKYSHKQTNLEWFNLDRVDIVDIIDFIESKLIERKERN